MTAGKTESETHWGLFEHTAPSTPSRIRKEELGTSGNQQPGTPMSLGVQKPEGMLNTPDSAWEDVAEEKYFAEAPRTPGIQNVMPLPGF